MKTATRRMNILGAAALATVVASVGIALASATPAQADPVTPCWGSSYFDYSKGKQVVVYNNCTNYTVRVRGCVWGGNFAGCGEYIYVPRG